MQWVKLYGSPLGVRDGNTDKMNENPEFASTWKGRILMHISCTDTKQSEIKLNPIDLDYK